MKNNIGVRSMAHEDRFEVKQKDKHEKSKQVAECDDPLSFAGSDLEWRVKYERLFEAHRKLQKTNNCLEDKLLKIVDKYEAEKMKMTKDLASQTQCLVESKLTIQRLHDLNCSLQSDLNLSITLLQNRPNCYVAQRIDTLPADVRASVKSFTSEKTREKNEGIKIRVPIPDEITAAGFNPSDCEADSNVVSAAILAKVLEERDKERQRDRKFCIDVGTQTHGWHFPAGKSSGKSNTNNVSSSSTGSGATPSKSSSSSSQCSTSSPSSPGQDKPGSKIPPEPSDTSRPKPTLSNVSRPSSVCLNGGGILFTSVIHTGGRQIFPDGITQKNQGLPHSLSLGQGLHGSQDASSHKLSLPLPMGPRMIHSFTYSTLQTDL